MEKIVYLDRPALERIADARPVRFREPVYRQELVAFLEPNFRRAVPYLDAFPRRTTKLRTSLRDWATQRQSCFARMGGSRRSSR